MKKQQLAAIHNTTNHVSDFGVFHAHCFVPVSIERRSLVTYLQFMFVSLQPKPMRMSDELPSSVHQEPPVCATPRSDMSSVLQDIGSVKLRSVAK